MFEIIKQAHQNNKYLLVKGAIDLQSFELNFNFDTLFSLFATHNYLKFLEKKQFVGQIIEVNSIFIFKKYIDYIQNNLKDLFKVGNLDFFYSLRGEVGPSHYDDENVIILGVKNTTYYHIDNIDLQIDQGDILYIPKNILHHSFSSRERIVLSLSLWEK